jgi:hypothetical protein
MTIAYHRFETEDRYYGMSLQVNLLGEYEVWTFWGGKGNARGGQKVHVIPTLAEGYAYLSKNSALRQKRGYRVVGDAYVNVGA